MTKDTYYANWADEDIPTTDDGDYLFASTPAKKPTTNELYEQGRQDATAGKPMAMAWNEAYVVGYRVGQAAKAEQVES